MVTAMAETIMEGERAEMLDIHQFPYGDDNYGVLLHCHNSGETAMVDAGDADAGEEALARTGWSLSQIWITHHHGDHTAGLASLKPLQCACDWSGKGKADSRR